MDDMLDIPEFLRREYDPNFVPTTTREARTQKIKYPKDGYLGKGLRKAARERLRARRRRKAIRCRER